MDMTALIADLDGIRIEQNDKIIQQKSRDFYWYSPVLKRQLDHVTADLVASPQNEDELIRILRACYRHDVPVTPRGTGTGNYGQAMPLSGGLVLSLADMNEIREIAPGRVICGPGVICSDLDKAVRAASGQEMRMHPSTAHTATIGGFIAGGSGGVGSISWGGLRDFGNIIRLRVVTMEAEPRALELTGEDLHKVTHAYGTNGIITEIEMPLAPAYDWVDAIVGFDRFDQAASYAQRAGTTGRHPDQADLGCRRPLPVRLFQASSEVPHRGPERGSGHGRAAQLRRLQGLHRAKCGRDRL